MEQAGLADHHGPCGYDQWPKSQAILPTYQIKIFSKEWFKDLLYKDHMCFMQKDHNKQTNDQLMETGTPSEDDQVQDKPKVVQRKTIFESNGCYWHGCPKRMTRRSQLRTDFHMKASDAYKRTFKLWCYEATEQYDSIQNLDGGLFSQYVNTFMKMKLTLSWRSTKNY
uniref:Uncharacterized protein n=1 Tax=Romanomermis culicivorax TaxID=13658 RepID=A0A915INS4_ROMCU